MQAQIKHRRLSTIKYAAAALSVLMLASVGCADIAIEGIKQYDYNYSITNLNDYPDYVFLTSSTIWGWEYASEVGSTGAFSGGYKLDGFQLHAIKSEDLDRGMLKSNDSDDKIKAARKEYFENNKNIVSSNLTLPVAASLEEALGLKSIDVFIEVNSINESALDISETKVVYSYLDGRTEELPVEDDDIPAPSNRTSAL